MTTPKKPITIRCPECSVKIAIGDNKLLGREVACPKCSHRFAVQLPAKLDVPTQSVAPRTPKRPQQGSAGVSGLRSVKRKNLATILVGAGLAVVLVFVAIVLAFHAGSRGEPKPDTRPKDKQLADAPRKDQSGSRGANNSQPKGGTSGTARNGAKSALLVGVNKYQHADLNKPQPLQYAEADVSELKEVLEKSGYTVTLLTGEQATLRNIREGIASLRQNSAGSAMVLAAFAGHGIQPEGSKEAYFCPYDSDQSIFERDGKKEADWDLKNSMLPLTEVILNLRASGAEGKAILVDACRNDPKTGRGRGFGTEFNVGDLPENLALLLSCSRGERAWEDVSWKHGAFFHHVLKGLREGKGAVEGYVTANSLAAYVTRAVRTDVPEIIKGGATQRPHAIINGEVDFLIKLDSGPKPEPKVGPSEIKLDSRPKPEPKVGPSEPPSQKEPKPGEERVFDFGNGVKMTFCWIPGTNGKARLGSHQGEDKREVDEVEHEVELDGFWMAKMEMTQGQYMKLTGKKNPSSFCADGGGKAKVAGMNTDEFPVEYVSWDDAKDCIKGLQLPRGMKKVGLPSEAQWEWACRGGRGNTRAFYFGDVLNGDKANHNGNYPYGTTTKGTYEARTTKVGSYETKAPHPWGLCDMHGNVWEWCEDYYGEYAKLPGGKNPVQTSKQSNDVRVLRGGSWNYISWYCRSAVRFDVAPVIRSNFIGFRVVFSSQD